MRFIHDCCHLTDDNEHRISGINLYTVYRLHCVLNGFEPAGKKIFYRAFSEHTGKPFRRAIRFGDHNSSGFYGVSLKMKISFKDFCHMNFLKQDDAKWFLHWCASRVQLPEGTVEKGPIPPEKGEKYIPVLTGETAESIAVAVCNAYPGVFVMNTGSLVSHMPDDPRYVINVVKIGCDYATDEEWRYLPTIPGKNHDEYIRQHGNSKALQQVLMSVPVI